MVSLARDGRCSSCKPARRAVAANNLYGRSIGLLCRNRHTQAWMDAAYRRVELLLPQRHVREPVGVNGDSNQARDARTSILHANYATTRGRCILCNAGGIPRAGFSTFQGCNPTWRGSSALVRQPRFALPPWQFHRSEAAPSSPFRRWRTRLMGNACNELRRP